jgi:hypothetical protein
MRLPEDSHPVKKFALQVDTSNGEAMDLVGGTVRKGSHYREAQHRLNFYRDKQIRRTLGYNAVHRIVPDRVITDLLPMDVGTVEHRFFYANNPLDARQKLRNRQYIARFVKTYGQ